MSEDPQRGDAHHNPLEDLLRQLGMLRPDGSMPDINELLARAETQLGGLAGPLQAMLGTPDGSALNPALVREAARKTTAMAGPDPTPSEADRQSAREAIELAQQWLAEHTAFDPVEGQAVAWSRAEWVEDTLPAWLRITEPVVSHVADALGRLFQDGGELDPQALAMLQPMMRQSAGGMLGAQLGRTLGELAGTVLTGTELVLPVTKTRHSALLSANAAAFAADTELPERDVRLYLALREVARNRLFASVGWLGPQLLALVEHYAREITIDRQTLEDAFGEGFVQGAQVNLEEIVDRVNGTLFEPATTPEQKEVLERVGTLVALVEGWVDEVVLQAAQPWLPNLAPLTEAVRRRRAQGGPAEIALQRIAGLELRPKQVRDAATLWAALRASRGVAGRDDVWRHPDLIPTARDLDDPMSYVDPAPAAGEDDALDRELAKLLRDERGGDATE